MKNQNGIWRSARTLTGLSFALAVISAGCIAPNISRAATAAGAKPLLAPPCDPGEVAARARTSYAFLGQKVSSPNTAFSAPFGRTQEEVNQRFASIIEANFNTSVAESVLGRLSDRELMGLAVRYQAVAGSNNTRLLSIFASRLSDQSLLRVASAFGKNAVTTAVLANSSPAVKTAFLAEASIVMALPYPPPGTTGWTNTLEQIYLDYRTSSTALGVVDALSATTIYAAAAVAGAWQAGTQVGNGINYLITNYDPSLGDAIGGTVANMLNAGDTAVNEVETGHYQNGFDSLFGLPISNSTDPSGPDDLTAPMVDYYSVYGPPDAGYDGGDGGCE